LKYHVLAQLRRTPLVNTAKPVILHLKIKLLHTAETILNNIFNRYSTASHAHCAMVMDRPINVMFIDFVHLIACIVQWLVQKQLTLYKVGCRRSLQRHVSFILLFYIGLGSVVLFVVQIIVFVLARFIQTSVARALEAGQPTAPAKGFVFKWGISKNSVDDKCPRLPSATPSHAAMASSVPATPATSKSIASEATTRTPSMAPSISSSLRPPVAKPVPIRHPPVVSPLHQPGAHFPSHPPVVHPSNTSVNMTHHNINEAANADSDNDIGDLLDVESIMSGLAISPRIHDIMDVKQQPIDMDPIMTGDRPRPSSPPGGEIFYNDDHVPSMDSGNRLPSKVTTTSMAPDTMLNAQSRQSTTMNDLFQRQQPCQQQKQLSSSETMSTQRGPVSQQQHQQQLQQQLRTLNGPARPAALVQSPVVAVSSSMLHRDTSYGPPSSTPNPTYRMVDEVQQLQARRPLTVGRGRCLISDQRRPVAQQQDKQDIGRLQGDLKQSSQRRVNNPLSRKR